MKRLPSIDIARGLVMVIMALDHTRDLLGVEAVQNPLDLKTTTPLLFFTRWITHLCAPAFVFLAGTSAWLYLTSDDSRARRRFLLTRGLVLIALEFTLVNFAVSFDIHFRLFVFEVIATIGVGMILLSFLSRLSPAIILVIAVVLIFGHDIIDRMAMPTSPVLGFIGSLLLGPGAFKITSHILLVIAYPILPWLGIMLAGFAAGRLFILPVKQYLRFFLYGGLFMLGFFVLLRFINVYGDPAPWSSHGHAFLSFMNVTKYPPSLLFTLVTLGVLFLILYFTETMNNAVSRILLVYGRVPLFYFILHLYLIHLLLFPIVLSQGYHWGELSFAPFQFGRPKGAGLSLGAVYLVWVTVVVVLYPVCRWYGKYKEDHRDKQWLRYF